ncbi:hypothetical protein DFH06DRAFT_1213415 [Mycena polygramma]|nr:hypothetical protein DFH06DRAFT_1213415 [Mycena polygramma]
MLRGSMLTVIFAMLVLGQGVLGAPQAAPCGEPEDPPCTSILEICGRTLIFVCRPAWTIVLRESTGPPPGVCGEVCALVNTTSVAPQEITCGKPEDPPCPVGQSCCLPEVGAPAGVCGEVCIL